MKDKSAIFLLVITVLIVWFVGKGLLSYWNNQVKSYYQITLTDICYKYDGDSEYEHFKTEDYKGNIIEKMRFQCEF